MYAKIALLQKTLALQQAHMLVEWLINLPKCVFSTVKIVSGFSAWLCSSTVTHVNEKSKHGCMWTWAGPHIARLINYLTKVELCTTIISTDGLQYFWNISVISGNYLDMKMICVSHFVMKPLWNQLLLSSSVY